MLKGHPLAHITDADDRVHAGKVWKERAAIPGGAALGAASAFASPRLLTLLSVFLSWTAVLAFLGAIVSWALERLGWRRWKRWGWRKWLFAAGGLVFVAGSEMASHRPTMLAGTYCKACPHT